MIIHIVSIIILVILLGWIAADIMLPRNTRLYYVLCIVLTLLVIAAETGCSVFDNTTPAGRPYSIAFNMIGFGLSPLVFIIESESYKMRKSSRLVYLPAAVNALCVLLAPFTGWLFSVAADCTFSRGPLFYAVYLPAFAFSVAVMAKRKLDVIHNYPHYFKRRIVASAVVLLAALVVQVWWPKYYVSWLVVTVYLVLYYALACEMGSIIDGPTRLLNRAAFDRIVNNPRLRKKSNCALIMLDINNFKAINDSKGHVYGDSCLIEIAQLLRQTFQSNGFIFRYGGDEFCVLLFEQPQQDVQQLVNDFCNNTSLKHAQNPCFPGVAVGCQLFDGETPAREIIAMADANMYANKTKMKEFE